MMRRTIKIPQAQAPGRQSLSAERAAALTTHFPDERASGGDFADDLAPEPLAAEGNGSDELRLADEVPAGVAENVELEDSHAPDDALGLYLRQMGAIPLLNREQELSLARRLETARKRFRKAA